jgi:ATP-dependent Lon protease
VPQEVRDELTFILVERIEEVLPAAFNQDATTVPPAERDEPLATSTAS